MKKQLKKPQLKIYFADMFLLDRIANIAEGLGIPMSSVGEILIKNSIADLEKTTERMVKKRNEQTKNAS